MDQPTIPGYEGLSPIGRGGFSRVFEATQQKFGRQVAIKVLNFGVNDQENRRSFARETQLMGRVSTHPNIVTVYDTTFSDQGQPCIVMELCSGGTIASRIRELGRLSPREVVDVGIAIASALEASHASGVLHRDIKPQNILISDFGQPALSDFGISAFDGDRPQTSDAGGLTLHYAAPEVIEGEMASAQSDIYSLAATLYTAAAGQRPFATPGTKVRPGELARRVIVEQPASLTQWDVPAALDDVIAHAMSKDRTKRPDTATDFLAALRKAARKLDGETSAPSPDPASTQAPAGAAGEDVVADAEDADTSTTVLRKDFERQRREAELTEPAVVDGSDQPVSSRRRLASIGLPLLAILVAGGAFLAFRGGEPTQTEPEPTVQQIAVDPVPAPSLPTDIVLERVNPGEILVRWESVDAGDESVDFDVVRSDGDHPTVRTSETEHLLTGLDDQEQPCIRVLARRGARTSDGTEPVCAEAAAAWVEILPNTCQIASCSVRLRVNGLPDNSRLNILVSNPDGADLNGFAPDAYETSAELNDDGDVIDWRLQLGTSLDTGRYQVLVSDDVGISAVGYFTVTE